MSGALVRGGPGTEIALNDILPSHLRGSSSRARKEAVAREYEAMHPGAVVVCDWEIIGDEDLDNMFGDERTQALADRKALADRREAAKNVDVPEEARGGDPDRLRESLRRAQNELSTLDFRGESYMKRFNELTSEIHQLQDALKIPRTTYKPNTLIESPLSKLSDARKAELQEKVQKYRTLPVPNRRKSIADAKDPILAQMLFDTEPEKTLRDLWAVKLVELGAQAAT